MRPLHLAAKHGHEAICRFLVKECQADVNARDSWQTPLHWAAEEGHEAVCRFLAKECQADVNARDEAQRTPLHERCTRGS